jgi:DNA helicase II / ATP-dependent DNA helicase PcrA
MNRTAGGRVSLVDVSLDFAQRRAVELPAGRALLVLGEAGHGKTTAALHRAAYLARSGAGASKRFRAAAVVPTEGLRGLVERALVRLGADVAALTYDRFARKQARRSFPGLPREGADTRPAVVRYKRDPALGVAIDAIAARRAGAVDDDLDAPRPEESASNVSIGDLQHLFGDRALLEQVRAAANGRLPAYGLDEVLEHTRVQFSPTSKDAFSHVTDRRRLVAVDGLSLDAGTPDADAATVDPEDYAVLFEIDRRRAIRRGLRPARPRAYDCLVLDEAQELAPLELALLGRSLARGASLVVAGDADQYVDDRACFAGWDATMRALGARDYDRVVLDVGYRCAEPVARLARHVRAPAEHPAPDGPDAAVASFLSEAALGDWLAGAVVRLVEAEPRAAVAVIARSPLTARRVVRRIRDALPARLVLDGAFSLAPGVDVTTVDQVRGLEFDHVVVPDASAAAYPLDPASRAALYVAITRARRSVACACAGEVTALV